MGLGFRFTGLRALIFRTSYMMEFPALRNQCLEWTRQEPVAFTTAQTRTGQFSSPSQAFGFRF